MLIRQVLIAFCAVVGLTMAMFVYAPRNANVSENTLLAGRYHTRSRSSRFFKRATVTTPTYTICTRCRRG